ncbi:MAG: ATP-dependent DNA helicase [Actinobacteria bacterium]|nr:ATP-dependent DNA helicase [Actinomycetota bacterium]
MPVAQSEKTSTRQKQAQARAVDLLEAVIANHRSAEDRPQQFEMTKLVAAAAVTGEPLIVQAGTGTGKSLAYLCGALGAEAKVVVSTATRQLSDQLVASDVPLIADVAEGILGNKISAVSLKGRSNYLCLAKIDELRRLDEQAPPPDDEIMEEDALDLGIEVPVVDPEPTKVPQRPTSADLVALNELLDWAESKPKSGDRSDGPTVADRVWTQVSTDAAGCPGARVCAFGEDCLAEAARARARVSDVVVANHALLAADLVSPNPILDDRDVIVVDEVHELQDYLSSAWGAEIFSGTMERIVLNASRRIPRTDEDAGLKAKAALADVGAVISALTGLPDQRWEGELPAQLRGPLESLEKRTTALANTLDALAKKAASSDGVATPEATALQLAKGQLGDLADALAAVRKPSPTMVRWSSQDRDGGPAVLRAAPLEVGYQFRERVGSRGLIATSATASVAGDFEPTAAMMGLIDPPMQGTDGEPIAHQWHGVDVGSPFDYERQAILYIPTDIPEPVGKERADHTAAVLEELTELVQAAGGRTLALFTTTNAARNAAAHLRRQTKFTILEHGELPAAVLAAEFAQDEESVLCATMGMWAGLNVTGPACTLVVIDKIPFAPMDDPLSAARRAHADQSGRNGFREVFVNQAALMLTQGSGRLIRSASDRGVVAILDPRLHTKGYGSIMLKSLPRMWRTTDRDLVISALGRLGE